MSGVIRNFIGQWPTPENEPTGQICRLIYIPNDERVISAVDGALSLVLNERYWRNEGETVEDTVWSLQEMFNDYLGSEGACPVEVQTESITISHFAASGSNGGTSVANTLTVLPFTGIERVNTTEGTLASNILTVPPSTWTIRAKHTLFQSSGSSIANSVLLLKVRQGILTASWQSQAVRHAAGTQVTLEIDKTVRTIGTTEIWLEYLTNVAQANTGLGSPKTSGLDELYGEITVSRPNVVTP